MASDSFGAASRSLNRTQVLAAQLQPNIHPAYELVRSTNVSEYAAQCTLYRHRKTGAEVLSVEKDDDNKVFGITFRTPPDDSKGIPHILEHSVLCGSEQYTSKEPFVALMKGSLNTFLNAFTYPDRTCYPVASQNTKDFYNLVNVYLDAVFFPRAIKDETVMMQEGWHYELDNASDPLVFKGVVFNEMKGVYSSPDALLGQATQHALFPDNAYGVDSGGDPKKIPDLTFEEFKKFHENRYHPSNSRVYFYGDNPVRPRLDALDMYLSRFDRMPEAPVSSAVAWQRKLSKPREIITHYPATSNDAKIFATVNWLLNDAALTPLERLGLGVVDHLLMGTSAATLRKKLTDSGLGASVIGGGLSDELMQATFSAGLKGCATRDAASSVAPLIIQCLEDIVRDGFEHDAIQASINTIEFSLREFNTGSYPKGLSFMLSAMSTWIYEMDPMHGIRFEEPLQQLKARVASGDRFLESMVSTFLLENKHRVMIIMEPDMKMEKKQHDAEVEILAREKASMSKESVDDVMQKTQMLKALQAAEDTPEAKATIPRLTLGDLERNEKEIPIHVQHNQTVQVVTHPMSAANGIIYAKVGFDLRQLQLSELPLLPLICRALTQTGTATLDRVALARRIGTVTGGVGASPWLSTPSNGNTVGDPDGILGYLYVTGKATRDHVGDLFDIIFDVLTTARLDNRERIVEMLKESVEQMKASVISSGHSYAITKMAASASLIGKVKEMMGGLSYLDTMKALLVQAQDEQGWRILLDRLEKVRATLLRGSLEQVVINLTGEERDMNDVQSRVLPGFIKRLHMLDRSMMAGQQRDTNWGKSLDGMPTNEGYEVSTQVNYVGCAVQLYNKGAHIHGSALVAAKLLRTGYLWDKVRVMGGAYGAFCVLNRNTGVMAFVSYRDPNLLATMKLYAGTGASFVDEVKKMSQSELELAIIGTIGEIDSPMSPDQQGEVSLSRWLTNETAETRQKLRDEILGTTQDDLIRFGHRLEAAFSAQQPARHVVVGSNASFASAISSMATEGMSPQFIVNAL